FKDSPPQEIELRPVLQGQDEFSFTFQGSVVTVDHGGLLHHSNLSPVLDSLGAFSTLIFDPEGGVLDSSTDTAKVAMVRQASLGNGGPGKLFICRDPAVTGTLEPLASEGSGGNQMLITTLPIPTHRLDDIEELKHVDWLLLSHLHDNMVLLDN